MTHPCLLRRGLLALSLSWASLPTWAGDDCEAPVARWQSREAVRQMAAREGWQIRRLKIDDGCYELRGTDAQGRSFKAKIDPETLQVLKMKLEDHRRERERDLNRDREREHNRERSAPQASPSQPGGAAPSPTTPPTPSPASAPGTAPRGRTN